MKALQTAAYLFVTWLVVAAPSVSAQPPGGARMRMPAYDASTEVTISGTVDKVLQPQHGRMTGSHLMVNTADGMIEVHLGPSSFVAREGFNFAAGDQVKVVGSKVMFGGAPAILAREVTKDGKTLNLRDTTGRPVWAGRGAKRPCCAQ